MNRKKIIIIILITVLFLFVYTTLSIQGVSAGFSLKPQWSVSIDTADVLPQEERKTNTFKIPFKTNSMYGYISSEGEVLQKTPYSYKASISSEYNTGYGESSTGFDLIDSEGQTIAEFEVSGFPFFVDDRIYVFLPGGSSVAQFDSSANKIWTFENYSPITAFDSSENGAIIGFADGNISGLFADGKKRFSFYPGGSEYEVILGAAISKSGNLSAAISGLEQQRFTVSKYSDGQNKIVFHEYLEKELTEQTFIMFSDDETEVYFNTANGFGIFNLEKQSVLYIPFAQKILMIEELPNKILAILSVEDDEYKISLVENSAYLLGSFTFTAPNAYIFAAKDSLYVTRGETISKMILERK